MASVCRERRRSEATSSCALLAGQALRRRDAGDDDGRGPRRVEREGQARAGLAAALSELARRLRQRAEERGVKPRSPLPLAATLRPMRNGRRFHNRFQVAVLSPDATAAERRKDRRLYGLRRRERWGSIRGFTDHGI